MEPACRAKYPDSNIHGANIGPTWDRQDPGGPHVGPMNFAIWVVINRKTPLAILAGSLTYALATLLIHYTVGKGGTV